MKPETLKHSNIEKRNDETQKPFVLKRREGTYVTFFGIHEEETILTEDALNCDAYFIESVGNWTNSGFPTERKNDNPQIYDLLGQIAKRQIQLDAFTEIAKQTSRPICYADLDINYGAIGLDVLITTIETVFGIKLYHNEIIGKQNNPTAKPETISRRHFLKFAKLAIASWLILPTLSDLLTVYRKNNSLHEISRTTHPEINIFIERLRDLIITYKEQWFLENTTNKGKVCNVMGAAHSGQKKLLNTTLEEKEQAIIKLIPLYKISVSTPETFYCLRTCHPNNECFSIEIPQLKEIWEMNHNYVHSPV